jgi:hypothetical protein
MRHGMSWVEWLALALIIAAVFMFLLGDKIFDSPRPGEDQATAAMRFAFAPFVATLIAIPIGLAGLLLFLVRPLVSLSPRVPLWLIPACGLILLLGMKPVCVASQNAGVLTVDDCAFVDVMLASPLTFFGVVLIARRFQVSS